MKILLVTLVLLCYSLIVFGQGNKITVLNDTTELQEYASGEKLKVNFKLNGKTISVKQKNKLLNDYPGIRQEFNIIQSADGIAGEILFREENINVTPEIIRPEKLDISGTITGKAFPGFTWSSLGDGNYSIDNLNGQIIVLNFWHTSCTPCLAEIPQLNELVTKFSGKNVVFIAATPNTASELTRFLEKKKFTYIQVPEIDTKTLFSPFPGWPIHVVLNSDGAVEFFAIGKQINIEQKLSGAIEKSLLKN